MALFYCMYFYIKARLGLQALVAFYWYDNVLGIAKH
jgi:hypothetical protein